MFRARLLLSLLVLSLLLLSGPGLRAGEDWVEGGPKEGPPPADEPASPSSEKPMTEKRLEGDREIYIPFKDLDKVFEKEGQGVFVPYAEFMKLWERSLDRRPVPAKPPVPHLITRATYRGEVDGDLAVVRAEIEFETFTEGWSAVPLGFRGVAMGEARLGEKPATLEAVKGGYRILVPEKGAYTLSLQFVAPIVKKEDTRTLAFRVPPTPVSRLDFEIPEERARVTVEPNLATTRTPAGSGVTRVMAFVGASDSVKLSYRPKPPEIEVGPALVFADAVVAASVEEAALRIRAEYAYRVFRSPLESVRLAVPAGARVLFVEGENLRSWDVADGTLTVTLHKPAEKAYKLAVTLEADLPEDGLAVVPEVRALDVAREQGFVLVRAAGTMKVLAEAQGLYRTDFGSVPKAARGADLAFAWRYPAHPWSLSLAVTRIEPVVDVVGRTLVSIDERRMTVSDTFNLNVTKVGIFRFSATVPEGLTVTDVSRDGVEDWRVADGVLTVDFKGSLLGGRAISVTSRRALALGEEPVDAAVPLLTPLGTRRIEGMVGIARDETLKLETKDVAGLVPAETGTFGRGVSLAYTYRQAERKATLTISRRDPEVTALVATTLRAQENRIHVTSRITFTVRYAGVDRFSFLLPATLKDEVHLTGNNIREQPKEDAGEDLFRQRVVLQGKELGNYVLTVEYDLPYEGLAAGDEKEVTIPSLDVEGVERERGVYAVYREPMLEIVAEADRLEPIDPRELPAGVVRKNVFLAYQYLAHPHALTLEVKKHDYLPVLVAVVHHMQLVTVLNDEGTARTEVVLQMTNNGLQFLSLQLPEGVERPDSLEVCTVVNGRLQRKKETPQRGSEGAILVRLPADAGPDDFFYVRIVYPQREEDGLPGLMFHALSYAAPVVQGGEVPILGTTWDVYPPRDVKITQLGGTLAPRERQDSWWSNTVNRYTHIFRTRKFVGVRRSGMTPAESQGGLLQLAPAGQWAHQFGGRSREPSVELAFADPGGFTFLIVLVGLLTLLGGLLTFRCPCTNGRKYYFLGCLGLPLLLIPVSAPGLAELLTAVVLGALVAAGWLAARTVAGVAGGVIRRRAEAKAEEAEEAEEAETLPEEKPAGEEEPAGDENASEKEE